MKYPLVNQRSIVNFSETTPPGTPNFRTQESTRASQPRKPSLRKTHNNLEGCFEKYTSLAQAAMGQGDQVLAETYYQYAEHALRLSNQVEEDDN